MGRHSFSLHKDSHGLGFLRGNIIKLRAPPGFTGRAQRVFIKDEITLIQADGPRRWGHCAESHILWYCNLHMTGVVANFAA